MLPIHIERLRDLYAMIVGIPERKIYLGVWRTGKFDKADGAPDAITAHEAAHDCGSTACAVGWACAYPKFQEQGLRFHRATYGYDVPVFTEHQTRYQNFAAVQEFFGLTLHEAHGLFLSVPENHHRVATGVTIWQEKGLSEKRRVLLRIRSLLLKKCVINRSRFHELAAYEEHL